jgi:hypothetical protein
VVLEAGLSGRVFLTTFEEYPATQGRWNLDSFGPSNP